MLKKSQVCYSTTKEKTFNMLVESNSWADNSNENYNLLALYKCACYICHYSYWTNYSQTICNSVLYIIRCAVFIVIIINSFFKHLLETTPHKINPVKLIAKVLNYSRKTNKRGNCNALTFWEEDYPAQLDMDMEKYGGPF